MEAPSAAATEGADAAAPALQLTAMPRHVAHKILALLPADERARAATTSRGWNAMLADRGLWTRLDLSPRAGVTCTVNIGALQAAAARAGRELRELDVSGCPMLSTAAICAVATANAATLRAVTVCAVRCELFAGAEATAIPFGMDAEEVSALLRAAPHLQTLDADVFAGDDALQARAVLRNEQPFGPLRIRHIMVNVLYYDDAALVRFAGDVAAHASLCGLVLFNTPVASHAALDALVSAMITRAACAPFTSFGLAFGRLPYWPVHSLARLVAGCGGTLKRLLLYGIVDSIVDVDGAAVLANALRESALTHLLFSAQNRLWGNPHAAQLLLSSLVAHPTLRVLEMYLNVHDALQCPVEVSLALAALVEADAAALAELHIHGNYYGDDALRPLFQALPRNTHLRALSCHCNNLSASFARDVALPAVRANASLTKLRMLNERHEGNEESAPLKRALEAEVAARSASAAAAASGAALERGSA